MPFRRFIMLVATLCAATQVGSAQAPKDDLRELSAAIAKLNGYSLTDSRDPARPPKAFQFRSPGPTDDDLKSLRPLLEAAPAPFGLNLNQCYGITDAGLAHLDGIKNLRSLSLGGTKVTEGGLKRLAGLTNLESLYLSDDKLTDQALEQVAKLTKLRQLSVYSKGITEDGYKHLAGLKNLEEFSVGGVGQDIGDAHLAHLKGLTQLRKLGVGGNKLTDAGIAHIRGLIELRELRIEGEKLTADAFKNLTPLTKLRNLTLLRCTAINGDAMSALKDMTALEELEIVYCGVIKPDASAHLKGLSGLKKLRFDAVADEALAGIGGLTKLESLQLYYTYISDEGVRHLRGLTGLKDLNLMKCRVTDAGLKHLSGLTNLQHLTLSENKIAGEGLVHLASLKNLKDLSLSECKVNDAGLKHLAGLTAVRELSLSGNPVTDAGLEFLKPLSGLTNLNLTGTKVNDDAVLALKKAMPKTRIRDIAGDDVTLEKPAPRKRPPVEDLTKVKPDFTLTADDLHKEYKDDRGATEKKYKNKVLEVSGTVSGMGRNIYDESYMSLKIDKDLIGILCVTADDAPWTKAVPGQKVRVRGRWPELAISAALMNCVVVEADASPVIVMTAEALAKEFKADPAATTKKYNDKYLQISGEVIDREFNSVGAATIQLKVSADMKVKCSFTAFEKAQAKQLKVGQKAVILGQYTLNFGADEVGLYFCHLIKSE